jgi:hypothetical protein
MTMPGKAAEGPVEALAAELEAARVLLCMQRELEAALLGGADGDAVLACVRRQEATVREAQVATHARRLFFGGPGSLEPFLEGRPVAEAEHLRRLAREAAGLREEIRDNARRADYLARRAVEWTRAQVEIVVRAISGPAVTYDAPGAPRRPRGAPSLLDRSA